MPTNSTSQNQQPNKNGAFRKKKTYFSQVSNSALRDENLSLKAKGLYALIQSYITIEGFTVYKTTLSKNCVEGEKAFESAWKELKEAGYLIQYRLQDKAPDENGKIKNSFYYEYDLLDVADKQLADQVHNSQNRKKQSEKKVSKPVDKSVDNPVDNSVGGNENTHNPKMGGMDKKAENQADTHNPISEDMANGGYAKGGVYNKTEENNTDLSNTDNNNKLLLQVDESNKKEKEVVVVTDTNQQSSTVDKDTFISKEIKPCWDSFQLGVPLTNQIIEFLCRLTAQYDLGLIQALIETSVGASNHIKYMQGVLRNWNEQGIKTYDDYFAIYHSDMV